MIPTFHHSCNRIILLQIKSFYLLISFFIFVFQVSIQNSSRYKVSYWLIPIYRIQNDKKIYRIQKNGNTAFKWNLFSISIMNHPFVASVLCYQLILHVPKKRVSRHTVYLIWNSLECYSQRSVINLILPYSSRCIKLLVI